MSDLTIVSGLKNMDYWTVERWRDSVLAQDRKTKAIVVSFGSDEPHLSQERDLFSDPRFTLIEVRRDTDMWREGRVYNIGVKKATSRFVVVTMMDTVLSPNFAGVVEDTLCARPNALVLCLRMETDPKTGQELGYAPNCNFGTCLGFERDWFERIGGFDEYYIGWGRWDMDFVYRAKEDNREWAWIESQTRISHPLHPNRRAGHVKYNDDYYNSVPVKNIVRNGSEWGKE